MGDERDEKDDPAEQLKQGLGLLFRAARGAAVSAKREMEKTDVGRSLEDAGREVVRAGANVVERIAEELNKLSGPTKERSAEPPAEAPPPKESKESEEDEFDGVKVPKNKPTGPTPQDPGFRIMVDDDDEKPR